MTYDLLKYNLTMKYFLTLATISLFFANSISAQSNSIPNIKDLNGNGVIEFLAFGDSITRGVGDNIPTGADVPSDSLTFPTGEAGYPLRLETWLGIPVSNRGVPGEEIGTAGILRFAPTVSSSNADYVIISEGINDVYKFYTPSRILADFQAMVNITDALGKEAVLFTIIPPCCERAGLRPFVESYNVQIRDIAAVNKLRMGDAEKVYNNSCDNEECHLLNLPEGLHPNKRGYDALAEVVSSALYGINLLLPGGTTLLAQALGVPESSIVSKSPTATTTP